MKSVAQIAAIAFAVLLILSAFLTLCAEAAGDFWIVKAPMLTRRDSLGVATVNGKLYAIGGNAHYANGSYRRTNANEEYDPAKNTWTTKEPMPTPRAGFAIAVYQNKIYCIGGYPPDFPSITGVNEVYDPLTDTWETKASMPTPRFYLSANVVNGKIYLIGGIRYPTTGELSNLNEVYDPATDTWTTKASIPTAVESYASAVVDNKIYVISSSLNQIYDPETDTWTLGNPSPHPATNAAAGATTGNWAPKRIYVIGGGTMGGVTNINQVYNPEDDSWTVGAEMPTARYALAVAVVRDRLYAIGGAPSIFSTVDISIRSVNEQYTPIGYGTLPPAISIVSPENKTYTANNVPLTFTVSEQTSWIGYSLDGQANVTIAGNTTLSGLSDGSHSLKVYAKDTAGNMGDSETVYFTISHKTQPSESFPTLWVAAAAATIAIGSVSLAAYYTKRKRANQKTQK